MRKIKERKEILDFYTSLELIILIVLHIYANWFREQPLKLYKEIHPKTLQINQNKIPKKYSNTKVKAEKWKSERIIYWLNRHWNSQCGGWQEAHVFVFSKNIFVIWLTCISHFAIFWDKYLNCEIEFHHSRERGSPNGS